MAFLVSLFALSGLSFFLYEIFRLWRESKGLPPGYNGLPIVGFLPFMKHWTWLGNGPQKIKEVESAPVNSSRVGKKLYVQLTQYEPAREAFYVQGNNFAGRPTDQPGYIYPNPLRKGVVWSDGDVWRICRRFTASSLRDFGMGKLSMEGKILEECEHLAQEIERKGDKPFEPLLMLMNAASNVVCNMVFGERYPYTDAKFNKMMQYVDSNLKGRPLVWIIMNVFPWLSHFPVFPAHIEKAQKINNFLAERVVEHRMSGKKNDWLGNLLTEISEGTEKSATLENNIIEMLWNLFIAGTDTTASTMQWFLLYMLHYPDVQQRIRDEVTALGESASYEHKDLCPYTESVIMEVQRLCNVAVGSLPHRNFEEATINGYKIPADSVVVINLERIHLDANYWGDDVKDFKPERFIGPDGKVDNRIGAFMPFSLGKRQCVGNTLAKMELFMMVTYLLSHFKFVSPEGVTPSALDYKIPGMISHPEPFDIVAIKLRN